MIFALLLACASRAPYGDTFVGDVPDPPDYAAAVRDATRELRLYDGLSTVLLLRAAWLDADFRRAQEAQRAYVLLLEPAEREAALATSLAEAEAAHVFLLSADSQDRPGLRFGDDAPWRLRAFAAGEPCTLLSVTERDPTPLDARLLPFHSSWAKLWEARFSADCGRSSPIVLQVAGPGGAGELGWRSAPGG